MSQPTFVRDMPTGGYYQGCKKKDTDLDKTTVDNAVLTPTQTGNCTGSRIGMFANNVENWSEKRLVQTSPQHANTLEALDSAQALKCMKDCEYVYVTEDNRVVSIWTYNDVTPNNPVARGQKRVLVPAYSKKK